VRSVKHVKNTACQLPLHCYNRGSICMGLRTLGKPFNWSKIKTKDVVDTQATVYYRHTVQYKTHTVQRHTRGSVIHQRRSALHALFGRGILPYMQQNISSHAACCSVGLIEGGIVLQACLMVPCRAPNGAAALFRLLKGEESLCPNPILHQYICCCQWSCVLCILV
jgi:hypothetical protein